MVSELASRRHCMSGHLFTSRMLQNDTLDDNIISFVHIKPKSRVSQHEKEACCDEIVVRNHFITWAGYEAERQPYFAQDYAWHFSQYQAEQH